MKILVTGATGTVGSAVVRHLAGHGQQLRVLVRDPAKVSFGPEVEVVQGDLTNEADVRRALDGVDRAFLNMADDNGALTAKVAAETRLGYVALLSSFAAVVTLPSGEDNIISARHQAGEAALTAAGVPSGFLRAAGFDYNVLMWAGDANNGIIHSPYPDVQLPIVDPDDIAASAAALLLAETPPTGAFDITGPEKVSAREQAATLSELLGRELWIEPISEAQAKVEHFPAGTPDFVSQSVIETQGEAAATFEVSKDVQRLTGRAPRSFRDWAVAHLQAFG
jgi:(4-alkanoyl-5-oxo-2,5-dihydrofuran-3-yl)methyl phosphate reductase